MPTTTTVAAGQAAFFHMCAYVVFRQSARPCLRNRQANDSRKLHEHGTGKAGVRMLGAMLYGPHDLRVEERPEPTILEPTDAIVRVAASCVCGSDLWSYRGITRITEPMAMGHEYC